MVALAVDVVVGQTVYVAGTDHTTMPADVVDEIRNENAWVGGVVPPQSGAAAGLRRLTGQELLTVGAARAAIIGTSDPSEAVIPPSGDTTGAKDSAAINASLLSNGATRLTAGNYYISNLGIVRNNRMLVGAGHSTVLNIIAGQPGVTLVGPGNVQVRDLAFAGGARGIVVNGAYDANFANLWFSGQTLGGVQVNGDLATEQHWTDIVMRGVGGVGFAIDRTTSIYTGSLYLDRVRLVEPAAGATHGFRFQSSAGSPSLNIAFLSQCVADNYAGHAYYASNVGQIFASNCWFAINGSGPVGSAAMRIINPFQQSYSGCYTYSGMSAPSVVISGTSKGCDIGAGHVFDGATGTTALGLTGVTAGGYQLGSYQNFCGAGLVDVPAKLVLPQPTLPGTTAAHGEEAFSRMFCNNAVQLTPGSMTLTYFTATKSELISTIEAQVGDARVGGTYVGYGLFTVAPDGTLTLVAKAEQTTTLTLWGSAFQPIGGFDTKLGLSAVYSKVAGQRYAIGALQVGGTGVKLQGNLQSNGTPASSLAVANTTLGPLGAVKAGMATLGAIGSTIAANTLTGTGIIPYFLTN